MQEFFRVLLFALCVALVIGIATYHAQFLWQTDTISPTTLEGSVISTVPIGGDFTLVDGENTIDQTAFLGQHNIVYFGYSYCPDVCPTSLLVMMNAYDLLPAEVQARLKPIFVTVDPKRDTPQHMAAYTQDFHPALHGWSGSPTQIDIVKKRYRVYAAIVPDAEAEANGTYLVNHSSMFYLINPDGQFHTMFSDNINSEILSKNLLKIIR